MICQAHAKPYRVFTSMVPLSSRDLRLIDARCCRSAQSPVRPEAVEALDLAVKRAPPSKGRTSCLAGFCSRQGSCTHRHASLPSRPCVCYPALPACVTRMAVFDSKSSVHVLVQHGCSDDGVKADSSPSPVRVRVRSQTSAELSRQRTDGTACAVQVKPSRLWLSSASLLSALASRQHSVTWKTLPFLQVCLADLAGCLVSNTGRGI